MSNFSIEKTEEIIQKVDNNLHIAAIFIVLCAGFLGVFSPSFLIKRKWLALTDKKFILGKAFSGGIILGTGFIHMLPEAQNQLNESLPEFPFSGFFAGMAAIFSLTIEQIAFEKIKKVFEKSQPKTNGSGNSNTGNQIEMAHIHIETTETKVIIPNSATLRERENMIQFGCEGMKACNGCSPTEIYPVQKINGEVLTENHQEKNCAKHEDCLKNEEGHHTSKSHSHYPHKENGHTHGVANLYTDEELCKRVNSFTIAHVLEIGIAFHSIIIGIALSVETGATKFHALLIAICFHQLFEGFALGASMQGARIVSFLHLGIMMSIFSLATPIGQVIGLGVLEMYDEESSTALQTQGIFNSFSGGILIYMALVDLIGEDFKKAYDGNLRYWMILALCTGFGFMSIIAIWA